MPPESRWFVKTSFACLILASILGTVNFGWSVPFEGEAPRWLRPLHVHLATVGWLVNLVFGVALWMFPMPKGATREFRPRYPRSAAVACFLLLNTGLALRFIAEPLQAPLLGLACGVLQTLGIGVGVACLWPRIRAITPPGPAPSSREPARPGT